MVNDNIEENINRNQFGGMGGASTTDAIVEMIIFTTNDQSHSTTGVYKIGLSDHYMMYTIYSSVRDWDGHHEKVLQFRNYKTFSSE